MLRIEARASAIMEGTSSKDLLKLFKCMVMVVSTTESYILHFSMPDKKSKCVNYKKVIKSNAKR